MTWEELNEKHDYDSDGLIECVPCDVRREISKALAGGALHPYKATGCVLERMHVDLDEVDRLYSKRSIHKGRRSSNKAGDPRVPKSFAEYKSDLGDEVANRAEVLAAMDCLMHHMKDEDDFSQWTDNAIMDEQNWNILDWDPDEGAYRCKAYMDIARHMDDHSFECVCRTFADIVRGQCFTTEYREGAFDGSPMGAMGDKR